MIHFIKKMGIVALGFILMIILLAISYAIIEITVVVLEHVFSFGNISEMDKLLGIGWIFICIMASITGQSLMDEINKDEW